MTETALDKLLRLASADVLEPSALGMVDKSDEDEAHDHLMKECSWYKAVCDGEGAANPGDHCKGGNCDSGGALVKFTPHTAEASTVVKPTVPPGGPGLFHVKGLHLPPYIEHLYPHLVGRYGKKKAYGVAVGIVKKWAKGVNPGGWKTKSGKGKKTHPDVQAAASRNVAEWEKDKAAGKGKHVKASAPVPASGMSPLKPGKQPFPGDELRQIPAMPRGGDAKDMYVAHRLDDTLRHLAHARERLHVANAEKSRRGYHMIHVNNHLIGALTTGHDLVEAVKESFPAEAKELEAVTEVMGLAKDESLNEDCKVATFSHLLQTILYHLAHAKRHAEVMLDPDPSKVWVFNYDHCKRHTDGAQEHTYKLSKHIQANYPEAGRWLKLLTDDADPNTPLVPLAAPAAWPSGKPYAKSFLSPQRESISAPGAGQFDYSYGQLKQEPSQTVSPSPPLPPKVDLPTPKELRAFAAEIRKMADDQDHHLVGAQMHLESAAEKMATNPVNALHSLRSCQTAIQQAWRWRVQHAVPRIAYAFSSNTPPAEQSSQQQIWAKEQDRIGEMQGAASKIAVFIDRVRRSYFGRMGMENQTAGGGLMGQPNARL